MISFEFLLSLVSCLAICLPTADCLLALRQHFLHPPDLSILQAHLDAVRMRSGRCQNIFHHADCALARALILLEHNRNSQAGTNIFAMLSVHIRLFTCAPVMWATPV